MKLRGGPFDGHDVETQSFNSYIEVPEVVPPLRVPTENDVAVVRSDGSRTLWLDPDCNVGFVIHRYTNDGAYMGVPGVTA